MQMRIAGLRDSDTKVREREREREKGRERERENVREAICKGMMFRRMVKQKKRTD
jgi:hypothetical protein